MFWVFILLYHLHQVNQGHLPISNGKKRSFGKPSAETPPQDHTRVTHSSVNLLDL